MMPGEQIHRRNFLKSTFGLGAFALAGRLPRLEAGDIEPPTRHFAPVNIAKDRLIRTLVGLRPYRREGYVVRAEKLGDKTLIHNYGHGGAGVTLSWGTSTVAADLALATAAKDFAIVGCGALGLTTARLLQRSKTIEVRLFPRQLFSGQAPHQWRLRLNCCTNSAPRPSNNTS